MGVLNLRGVDEELVRKLKQDALSQGKTLKGWCVELLSAVYEGEKIPAGKPQAVEQPKAKKIEAEPAVESAKPKPVEQPVRKLGTCPVCSGPLNPWGAVKRCMSCQRNF